MGNSASTIKSGKDFLDAYNIVVKNKDPVINLTEAEAQEIWAAAGGDAVDAEGKSQLDLRKLWEGQAAKLSARLVERFSASIEEKRKALKPKKQEQEKKRFEQGLEVFNKELSTGGPVTYFLRAAKASGDIPTKEQFLRVATAGGRPHMDDLWKWAAHNQYIAPTEAPPAAAPVVDESKMTEAERKQQALLRNRQQLLTRDDAAERQAKEARQRQIDRIADIFRRCDKDGSNKLDSATELRALVQMWYVPTEEEVAACMAEFGAATEIDVATFIRALTAVHGLDVASLDQALVDDLRANFAAAAGVTPLALPAGAPADAVPPNEIKTLAIEKVRDLILSSYLAPQAIVDAFIAIIDEEKKGEVVITQIIEQYSALEQAFPDIFARLREYEQARMSRVRGPSVARARAASAAGQPKAQELQLQEQQADPAAETVAAPAPVAEAVAESAPEPAAEAASAGVETEVASAEQPVEQPAEEAEPEAAG